MLTYNVQNLEVVGVVPTRYGIFVCAKYQDWCHLFNFFIDADGKVRGKADSGDWLETGTELSSCIQARVQAALIERHGFLS